ncbi:hypothetical protein HI914_04484 [Erysiphe necator]|nr:hypothetical protein HI914_04484 [Erysiphe necator]
MATLRARKLPTAIRVALSAANGAKFAAIFSSSTHLCSSPVSCYGHSSSRINLSEDSIGIGWVGAPAQTLTKYQED